MDFVNKVVGISVGLLVAALLMPVALDAISNSTLTNVDPAVVTVFQVLLPVLAVIGIAIYMIRAE
jgi:hypothetical protein